MGELVTAADEYAKDAKLRPADITQLRDWLTKQPHLPQCISDEFLITILHSSEYSVEQSKRLLDSNITCRTNFTEFFSNRDPLAADKQAVWDYVNFWVSPFVTADKYRIFYGGLKHFDSEPFDFPNLVNIFMSTVDTILWEQGICPGYAIVLNCHGFTIAHLTKCNISLIRNVIHYIQEAICLKIRAIHVINCSPIIDKIMFLIKPFLKKELLDMLFFHYGEMKDFYQVIPRDLLPEEIGGTSGGHIDLLTKQMRARVECRQHTLIDSEKLKIDEKKRPGGKKDTYSVAGHFRKLELD
uniref:CRAL-TRIO domain-containing protein n=1 Tax=Cuerna arida TaxID=1464854 RepID=A0A1B6F0L5_9HEMI